MFRTALFTVALVAAAPSLAQVTETTMARADLVKSAEAAFAKVDTNHDGQMSKTEIETFQRNAAAKMVADRNAAIFAQFDTDKNGQLSVAEFAKLTAPSTPDISTIMRNDTNKDGQISLAEHRAAATETFNKVDTNHDGILTAAEAQAAAPGRK